MEKFRCKMNIRLCIRGIKSWSNWKQQGLGPLVLRQVLIKPIPENG